MKFYTYKKKAIMNTLLHKNFPFKNYVMFKLDEKLILNNTLCYNNVDDYDIFKL
jgi:hypothetical protein